jgi:hypothetical protein
MTLTPAQAATLKAAINANPTWAAYPLEGDGPFDLAAVLNQPASPAFSVWRTDAPVNAIVDAINWANYTPSEAIAASDPALSQQVARLLTIQTKQMNLQLMLQGRESLNCARPNVRAGLRDAVIQIPSGSGGASTSPGGASGVTVLNACVRNATEAEKIFAAQSQASDTTGSVTARVMTFEGNLSASDIQQARNV